MRSGMILLCFSVVSRHPEQGWHIVGAQFMCEISGGGSWGPRGLADGKAGCNREPWAGVEQRRV